MKTIIGWVLVIIGVVLWVLQIIPIIRYGGIPNNILGSALGISYSIGFYIGFFWAGILGTVLIIVGRIMKGQRFKSKLDYSKATEKFKAINEEQSPNLKTNNTTLELTQEE